MTSQPIKSVLISGGGIAGPVLAYWLAQAGIHSTILERAPDLRTAGQIIDIRGPGIQVIKQMGLEDMIRSRTTKEVGIVMINGYGKESAKFPMADDGKSFTAEIEILRSELVKIFHDASVENEEGLVEWKFGDYVKDVQEDEKSSQVNITFANSGEQKSYDLFVIAEGQGSRTRSKVFSSEEITQNHLGQYCAYFTIPKGPNDTTWSKFYHAPGGRFILVRPDNAGNTRSYLTIMNPALSGIGSKSITEQKHLMTDYFSDAGWEIDRILNGMQTADDFYIQEVLQIKTPTWSKSHVVMLGDTAYCASPISGAGTTLAILGAYILGKEICKHAQDGDYAQAFAGYDKMMRPFVDEAQKLPPGVPAIACPQTAWGVGVLRFVVNTVAYTGLFKLFNKFTTSSADEMKLPVYD